MLDQETSGPQPRFPNATYGNSGAAGSRIERAIGQTHSPPDLAVVTFCMGVSLNFLKLLLTDIQPIPILRVRRAIPAFGATSGRRKSREVPA